MESFDYIESGIIFGLDTKNNLRTFNKHSVDFSVHGDAYRFVIKYFDDYGEFPSEATLVENFPSLDPSAQSLKWEYATKIFGNQVLYRKMVGLINSNRDLIHTEPKNAMTKIMAGLQDLEVLHDDDIQSYTKSSGSRLDEWRSRKERRKLGDGIMGVPTSFPSVNSTGIGWLPGELISVYARPTVGKTWMCVHAAATAVAKGFRTLLISTEMPTNQISLRTDVVLANMMGFNLSHKAIRSGDQIDEGEYQRFLDAIHDQQLLICDHIEGATSISVENIAGLIRKHKPELVVIDGIYLINTGVGNRKAMWEQSHSVFYGMKNLAQTTNTPIFVSTQANRDAAHMYSPPRPDQVAFGDALIRASDVAMAMSLVEDEDNKRLVQFQKYRDGILPIETTAMQWNVDSGEVHETTFGGLY